MSRRQSPAVGLSIRQIATATGLSSNRVHQLLGSKSPARSPGGSVSGVVRRRPPLTQGHADLQVRPCWRGGRIPRLVGSSAVREGLNESVRAVHRESRPTPLDFVFWSGRHGLLVEGSGMLPIIRKREVVWAAEILPQGIEVDERFANMTGMETNSLANTLRGGTGP